MEVEQRVTKAMQTRQRIVASAAHEFAMRGYDGTSLRLVASGAGLQLGSLYFHFESKAELLSEVLRDAVDLALARIDLAIDDLGPGSAGPEQMAAAIEANLAVLHESRDLGAAVVRVMDPNATGPDEARDHARRYVSRWRHLIARSRGRDEPTRDDLLTSVLLLGAMNATVGRRQLEPEDIGPIAAAVKQHFVP